MPPTDTDDPTKVGDVIAETFGPPGDPDAGDPGETGKKPLKKPTVVAAEPLGELAGLPVLALGLKLTKVGDGLSTAMTVTGRQHEKGERVYIVTEAELRKFEHDGMKDIDAWRCVEVFDGVRSTIVSSESPQAAALAKLLDRQDTANSKAEAAAQEIPGQGVLIGEDG